MSESLRRVLLALVIECSLVGIFVLLVALFVVPWWLAVVVGFVAAALLFAVVIVAAPALVRRWVCAGADTEVPPRLQNVVEGLRGVFGLPEPRIVVVDDAAPNALVCGRSPSSADLIVTSGLDQELGRVELEAVVAHLFSRIRTGDLLSDTLAAVAVRPLQPLPGTRTAVLRWILGEHHSLRADLDGVRLTRYPPGLAAALTTLHADGRVVRCGDRTAQHLWIDEPVTDPATAVHLSTAERVQALQEL